MGFFLQIDLYNYKWVAASVLNHSTFEFQDFSERAPGS